jgi:hypothetical protein
MMSDENLQTEYEQCFDNWRFLVGLRFTLLAFFLTLTSGLVYIALQLFGSRAFQSVVTGVGVVSSVLMYILEHRTGKLYAVCMARAATIEEYLHPQTAKDCLAHKLEAQVPTLFSRHATGIYGFYVVAGVIWFLLFVAAWSGEFREFPELSKP